ncbi:hypothetical protein B0A49_00132 [Cryomyces minteri]|uniref:Phosphatidylinositol 4-kinase n=1 Tax=Cryomyces minteri TaxID=331657 RepID=A0A4U0Y3T0_9PEZI|nr:hypothetical protein B0A49_00132 [Cryomyces minteri]
MPRVRPPTSGYARIAQAEEEEDPLEDSEEDDHQHNQASLSSQGIQYAPIQPRRQDRMRMAGSESPSRRRSLTRGRARSNSGVDIKAINARLEKWADEIASVFKIRKVKGKTEEEEQLEIHHSVFQAPDWIRPVTAETLASQYDSKNTGNRMTKDEFDRVVESVRVAIELGTHPKMISQGSSGSYFARNTEGKVVGVFKPKDEEPYASKNPKWTKWLHRNLFPFAFGRACLIPNLSYVSEAAAYVLDTQLRTNLVPYTDIVSLSSKSFYYDFWERRAYYRKKKPFPEKIGSFQVFLKGFKDANVFLKEHPWPDQHNPSFRTDVAPKKKRRRWDEDCRPRGAPSDDEEDYDDLQPSASEDFRSRSRFWTESLQQSFREQLEKLVILDYIMRNTDRGLDNWMIRIDEKTQKATIVAEPPRIDEQSNDEPLSGTTNGNGSAEYYKRREIMTATNRTATPTEAGCEAKVSIGAIDNSLSWPWKHPDAWRSFPFGWLFLPVSLIGQPFSEATRLHFLPLLTSKQWWSDTQLALRRCFSQDSDFQEQMYARQIAVMKGQAWNVVETLKTPDHGPLELTRRARVCVWDDLVDIPVAVPLRVPSAEMRRRQAAETKKSHNMLEEEEEMDISAAHASSAPQLQHDLLGLGAPASELQTPNRFNISRQTSSNDARNASDDTNNNTGPLSSPAIEALSATQLSNSTSKSRSPSRPTSDRPPALRSATRMSYEEPHTTRHASPDHHRRRRSSFAARRASNGFLDNDDDLEGDLGYAAAEDMEANKKKVIVERLETVKSKKPVFTWC